MKKFLLQFIKNFLRDDCYLCASALSFYTLLSIVPAIAIIFGVAKGFGFEPALEHEIRELLYQQSAFADKLINFAKSTLENAHGSLIAGVGIIGLFWSAISLLGSFETALNRIWNIPIDRTFNERVAAYLPLLIFGPLLIVASSSATYIIVQKIIDLSLQQGIYPAIKPAIHVSYYAALIVVSWLFFLFLLTYIPNRKISWTWCALPALLTAISFQFLQWSFIHFQIYLTSYNAIYGSLAAIPLFLLWLQWTWLAILAGAELCKLHAVIRKQASMPISERGLFLLILMLCCKAYLNRKPPLTQEQISNTLSLDLLISEKILRRFEASGLLVRVINNQIEGYIPKVPPGKMMVDEALAAIDDSEDPLFHVSDSIERNIVLQTLHEWDLEQKNLATNISMEALIAKNIS